MSTSVELQAQLAAAQNALNAGQITQSQYNEFYYRQTVLIAEAKQREGTAASPLPYDPSDSGPRTGVTPGIGTTTGGQPTGNYVRTPGGGFTVDYYQGERDNLSYLLQHGNISREEYDLRYGEYTWQMEQLGYVEPVPERSASVVAYDLLVAQSSGEGFNPYEIIEKNDQSRGLYVYPQKSSPEVQVLKNELLETSEGQKIVEQNKAGVQNSNPLQSYIQRVDDYNLYGVPASGTAPVGGNVFGTPDVLNIDNAFGLGTRMEAQRITAQDTKYQQWVNEGTLEQSKYDVWRANADEYLSVLSGNDQILKDAYRDYRFWENVEHQVNLAGLLITPFFLPSSPAYLGYFATRAATNAAFGVGLTAGMNYLTKGEVGSPYELFMGGVWGINFAGAAEDLFRYGGYGFMRAGNQLGAKAIYNIPEMTLSSVSGNRVGAGLIRFGYGLSTGTGFGGWVGRPGLMAAFGGGVDYAITRDTSSALRSAVIAGGITLAFMAGSKLVDIRYGPRTGVDRANLYNEYGTRETSLLNLGEGQGHKSTNTYGKGYLETYTTIERVSPSVREAFDNFNIDRLKLGGTSQEMTTFSLDGRSTGSLRGEVPAEISLPGSVISVVAGKPSTSFLEITNTPVNRGLDIPTVTTPTDTAYLTSTPKESSLTNTNTEISTPEKVTLPITSPAKEIKPNSPLGELGVTNELVNNPENFDLGITSPSGKPETTILDNALNPPAPPATDLSLVTQKPSTVMQETVNVKGGETDLPITRETLSFTNKLTLQDKIQLDTLSSTNNTSLTEKTIFWSNYSAVQITGHFNPEYELYYKSRALGGKSPNQSSLGAKGEVYDTLEPLAWLGSKLRLGKYNLRLALSLERGLHEFSAPKNKWGKGLPSSSEIAAASPTEKLFVSRGFPSRASLHLSLSAMGSRGKNVVDTIVGGKTYLSIHTRDPITGGRRLWVDAGIRRGMGLSSRETMERYQYAHNNPTEGYDPEFLKDLSPQQRRALADAARDQRDVERAIWGYENLGTSEEFDPPARDARDQAYGFNVDATNYVPAANYVGSEAGRPSASADGGRGTRRGGVEAVLSTQQTATQENASPFGNVVGMTTIQGVGENPLMGVVGGMLYSKAQRRLVQQRGLDRYEVAQGNRLGYSQREVLDTNSAMRNMLPEVASNVLELNDLSLGNIVGLNRLPGYTYPTPTYSREPQLTLNDSVLALVEMQDAAQSQGQMSRLDQALRLDQSQRTSVTQESLLDFGRPIVSPSRGLPFPALWLPGIPGGSSQKHFGTRRGHVAKKKHPIPLPDDLLNQIGVKQRRVNLLGSLTPKRSKPVTRKRNASAKKKSTKKSGRRKRRQN